MAKIIRRLMIATTALIVVSATGCSVVLKADEQQCTVDSDCAGRGFTDARCEANVCVSGGGSSGGPWDCVGNVEWDTPADTPRVPIHMRLARLLGEDPVPNAPAKVCPPLDVTCSTPIDEGVTDAMGELTLDTSYGFRGYTLISPPADFQEMAPAILWSNPPRFEEVPKESTQTAHLTSIGDVMGVAAIIGAEIQDDHGHVFGLTLDCNGNTASGVSLTADTVSPSTVQYYLQGGVPSNTAASTDGEGLGGFANLPGDQFITFTATQEDVGRIGTVTALVKPGHVTYLPLAPSPL